MSATGAPSPPVGVAVAGTAAGAGPVSPSASSAHVLLCPTQLTVDHKDSRVFFDETSSELIAVKNGMDIQTIPCQRLNGKAPAFPPAIVRISNRGAVFSCPRFSLDRKFVAILRSETNVELVSTGKAPQAECIMTCKAKRPPVNIVAFYWTFPDEFFIVTNQGVETYTHNPSKNSVKLVKSFELPVQWCVYSHPSRVLLLATNGKGTALQPFLFRKGSAIKMAKFDIELPPRLRNAVTSADICLSFIYGKLYCIHINSELKEITLYHISKDSVVKRALIPLPPPRDGRLGTSTSADCRVSVMDNLLIVHSLTLQSTFVYDIKESTHTPIAEALPLAVSTKGPEVLSKTPDIYLAGWEFYTPDIILDRAQGICWTVGIDLPAIAGDFVDRKRLLAFLLKRNDSKRLVLKTLRNIIINREPLDSIGQTFDMLNEVCELDVTERRAAEAAAQKQAEESMSTHYLFQYFTSSAQPESTAITPQDPPPANAEGGSTSRSRFRSPPGASPSAAAMNISAAGENDVSLSPSRSASFASETVRTTKDGYVIIEQGDMYTYVLVPLDEEKILDFRFMVAVLIEYIRSLNFHHIDVQHYLHELVINLLVGNRKYSQLHQFLQYHVVNDSAPVAFQLLSLDQVYPPAYQLALDMLKRLGTHEEIVEVLLSRKQIIPALRYVRQQKIKTVSTRRFLEVAYELEPSVFFTVYNFFEQRTNGKYREDGFERFVVLYEQMFGTPTSLQTLM